MSVAAGATAALCRFVLNLRLAAVAVTVLAALAVEPAAGLVVGGLLLLAAASLAALLRWEEVATGLAAHPSFLAADLVVAVGVLAVLGPESPFLYFTIGTALLGGILYGAVGAAFFSVLLFGGYLLALVLHVPVADEPLLFTTIVGTPLLYPLAGAAGAAVRRLIDRLVATEDALAQEREIVAISDERGRLAREMHDSLAKTLHGMAFTATALGTWVTRAPERAVAEARALAAACATAATEARELIGDLRADSLDDGFAAAVQRWSEHWSKTTGVAVTLDTADVALSCADARYELLCILKEALRNVDRHAAAAHVVIELTDPDDTIVLAITDDGTGLTKPPCPEVLAEAGHYGLLGMRERAERVGGQVTYTLADGGGLRVEVCVPVPVREPAPPGPKELVA